MRRDQLLWGIVLLAFGLVLLLRQLGVLPVGFSWAVMGPVLLIGLGFWVLWSSTTRSEPQADRVTIPLEGIERARIRLKHGAGRLHIGASAGPGELLSGTFMGGVRHEITRQGDTAELQLSLAPGTPPWTGWPLWGRPGGLAWDVNLSPEVAIDLHVETGASEATLRLADLNVTSFHLKTGISAARITLPAHAGRVQARIDSGVAETTIRVPDGLAARIRVENGLGDARVDEQRFPRSDGGYASPDYAEAADAVDLDVRNGIGAVRIE
ncbi:MAG TPA: hypothetical protein GX714_07375 [Chloroflexi bacterium]|jgi:hypothetical protein|nr:hypothetical protein [Chloroflexota bacterium]